MARLNYVNNLTILSESPGKALVYFTLKDKKKSLTNSFSKYYDIYDKIDYICEVRNGQENWLFSGPEIYINELKNNLDYSNLNDNLILSKENTMKDEIDMQKSLYLALGLDEEISTVLSVAKISGLLSNPADNKIRYITSRILGISSEQLMCMIEDGMIRSMWLIESIHKMERRLYYNRKGLKQKSETPYTGLSNDMFFGNDEIKKLLTQRSSHGCIYTFFNYMKVMFESAFAIMGISTSQKTSLMFYHPYFSMCKKAVVRLANTIM